MVTTNYGNGLESPTFTITTPGTIYSFRVASGSWEVNGGLANYISVNGNNIQGSWSTDFTNPSFITSRTVTLSPPIAVQTGDIIIISTTSLDQSRTFPSATDNSGFLISRFVTYASGETGI